MNIINMIVAAKMQSEVNDINKQKFLAELGKLLTFMYEEDRQTAIDMYGKMFDDADDEQALLQFLVSPTRQAVVIARSYNAKERKLQVHAQAKDGSANGNEDSVPDFVHAIDKIQLNALKQELVAPPTVSADQFSLFTDDSQPSADIPKPEDAAPSFDPADYGFSDNLFASDESSPAPTEQAPSEDDNASPAPEAEEESDSQPSALDPVDAFIANFTMENDALADAPAAEAAVPPAEIADTPAAEKNVPAVASENTGLTVRKPRVLLLLLYILLAIPVTLIGILILFIPTLLFFALAVMLICLGVITLMASFSGFAVLADVLVMLGVAIIILALGLLFLWVFIWFIGGAIVGFVSGILSLGSKWCYKEVQAE